MSTSSDSSPLSQSQPCHTQLSELSSVPIHNDNTVKSEQSDMSDHNMSRPITSRQRSSRNETVDRNSININIESNTVDTNKTSHNNHTATTTRISVKSAGKHHSGLLSWLEVPINNEFKQHVGYGWRSMIGATLAMYVSLYVGRPTFAIPFLIPIMSIIGSQPSLGQAMTSVWQCTTGTFWGVLLAYIAIVCGYSYNQIYVCVLLQWIFTLIVNYFSDPIVNRKLSAGMCSVVLLVQLITPADSAASAGGTFAFEIVALILIGALFGMLPQLITYYIQFVLLKISICTMLTLIISCSPIC